MNEPPTPTPRTDAILALLPGGQTCDPQLVADELRPPIAELERELTAWQTELSKVMPPDFKDWWQNSKTEWPLVARLVIEAKAANEDAMIDHEARLERELAAERALADRLALILDDIRYYDGLSPGAKQPVTEALAAWKEARSAQSRRPHPRPCERGPRRLG